MASVKDEAVCIRQWDWSETSQTVTLLCRGLGLLRAVAKGARRPKSPYSGGIEPLTRATIEVIPKPAGLANLTEWSLAETMPHFRKSLRAFFAGLYAADVAQNLLAERDPHPVLYDALLECLRTMADDARISESLLRFQWRALAEAGYAPSLETQPVAERGWVLFYPDRGGLGGAPHRRGGETAWRVRSTTIEALRALPAGRPGGPDSPAPDAGTGLGGHSIERASRLLGAYVRHILGRQLPTTSMVFRSLPGMRAALRSGDEVRGAGGR